MGQRDGWTGFPFSNFKIPGLFRTPENVSQDFGITQQCLKIKMTGSFLCYTYSVTVQFIVLPTVMLIIIGIPSPIHSFTLGLNPSFSANPPYRSLSFFSFRIHYMNFPDCLLLLLSISIFLLFSFFCFYTFLVVGSVR